MNYKIVEGDLVEISWEHLKSLIGQVIYTPVATGDSFHILSAGRLFYVQTFARIEKITDKEFLERMKEQSRERD